MAALAFPYRTEPRTTPGATTLRLVPTGAVPQDVRRVEVIPVPADAGAEGPAPARSTGAPTRARASRPGLARRLLPGVATLAAVAVIWYGAGALSGLRPAASAAHPAPGASLAAGERYVVQPGDTLWSIALRLDPTGDPRPVVDKLTAEVPGGVLQPGERVVLP